MTKASILFLCNYLNFNASKNYIFLISFFKNFFSKTQHSIIIPFNFIPKLFQIQLYLSVILHLIYLVSKNPISVICKFILLNFLKLS